MFFIFLIPSVLFIISFIYHVYGFFKDYSLEVLYWDNLFTVFFHLVVFFIFLFFLTKRKANIEKYLRVSMTHKFCFEFFLLFLVMLAYFSGISVLIWEDVPLWQ